MRHYLSLEAAIHDLNQDRVRSHSHLKLQNKTKQNKTKKKTQKQTYTLKVRYVNSKS